MSDDFDILDDDGGKVSVYVPTQKTRVFTSELALRKWLLSALERGHYIRDLTLIVGPETHTTKRNNADADDDRQTFRRRGRPPGRPPKPKRRGETPEDKKKRESRERSARYRARKKQKP